MTKATDESVVFGVDVGGTNLRLMAEDVRTGTRSAVHSVAVPGGIDEFADTLTTLLARVAPSASIAGLAVGLPGQVQDNRCIWIPNLRFLDGIALADLLAARVQAPCHLVNDAQATLVAEAGEGAAKGRSDVLLVAAGTGIGGAFQINGTLVRGAHGCAGSLGWLSFSNSGRDPDHGPWETAASGRALEGLARPFGDVPQLLAAARAGDATALRITDRYADLLGEGIASLASIIDPEVVVFAGGLVAALDVLHGPIMAAVSRYGSPSGRSIAVIPASLGSDAGVIGALRWAQQCLTADRRHP